MQVQTCTEYKPNRVHLRRSKPINNMRFDLITGICIWIDIMRLNVAPYSRFAVPCILVTLFKHPTGFFCSDQIDFKCRRRRKDCESVERGLDRVWSCTISSRTITKSHLFSMLSNLVIRHGGGQEDENSDWVQGYTKDRGCPPREMDVDQ